MDNWKLLLAGIRNSLKELVKNTFNIKGSVDVSNLPEIQKVEITNPQEPTETVQVSNLIDYKEYFNKIIGELIKVPKDIKTADYTPIIDTLKEVVRTLESDKTDYSPIVLAIESAVKELKKYSEFDDSNIIKALNGIPQFDLEKYLKYGELPVVINGKQFEDLIKAFGRQVAVAIQEGGGSVGIVGIKDATNTQINPATETTLTLVANELKTYAIQYAVNSGDSTITYVGKAAAGSSLASAVWQIKRITDTSGNLSIQFADGDSNFDNVWDNRESLSYS